SFVQKLGVYFFFLFHTSKKINPSSFSYMSSSIG
ncbi:MAG: hypothetical protein ACI81T_003123, partial [Bacteroidia bacterium]